MNKKHKKHHPYHISRTVVIRVSILVIVLLMLAGAGFWAYKSLVVQQRVEDQVSIAIDPIDSDVRDIHNLESEGNIEEAKSRAETAIDAAGDDIDKKRELTRSLANIEINAGKYDEALSILTSLSADAQNYAIYYDIGVVYERKGDKPLAIEYYQKAIDSWPKDDISYGPEVGYLKRHVAELQEGV